MAEPQILYTINRYPGDGTTTIWNINFAGGYLSRTHVKAYLQDEEDGGNQTIVNLTDDNFVGPNQLEITPAVPVGRRLTIYRDTPKDLPLVDFTNGSLMNERNLDRLAQQAVFVSAEMVDRFGTTLEDFNLASAAINDSRDAALQAAADAAAVAANFITLQNYVENKLDQQDLDIIQLQEDLNASLAAFQLSVTNQINNFESFVTGEVEVIDDKVQDVLDAVWRYDVATYLASKPVDAVEIFSVPIPRVATFPTDAVGSLVSCVVNPVEEAANLVLKKNGTSFGTLSIDTDGSLTATVTETPFSVGDVLSVTPDYLDTNTGFSGVGIVLRLEI